MSEAPQASPYSSSHPVGESPTLDRCLSFPKLILFSTLRFLGVVFLLALFRIYSREKITWEIALAVFLAVTFCFIVLHWLEFLSAHNRIIAHVLGIAAYAGGACSTLLLHYWIVNF